MPLEIFIKEEGLDENSDSYQREAKEDLYEGEPDFNYDSEADLCIRRFVCIENICG